MSKDAEAGFVRGLPCTGHTKFFLSTDVFDLLQARDLCLGCDLREPCLERALQLKEEWGMYGGVLLYKGEMPVTFTERRSGRRPKKPDLHVMHLKPEFIREELMGFLRDEPPPSFQGTFSYAKS